MKSLHCDFSYLMFQIVLSMKRVSFFLLFFLVIAEARVEKIQSYFIQKNFDYKSPPCTTCPDIECVHSGNSELISNPTKITACYRSYPMRYMSTWSTVFGFGKIKVGYLAHFSCIVDA